MHKTIINLVDSGVHIHLDKDGQEQIKLLMEDLKVPMEWENEPSSGILIIYTIDYDHLIKALIRLGILEGIARSIDQLKDLKV